MKFHQVLVTMCSVIMSPSLLSQRMWSGCWLWCVLVGTTCIPSRDSLIPTIYERPRLVSSASLRKEEATPCLLLSSRRAQDPWSMSHLRVPLPSPVTEGPTAVAQALDKDMFTPLCGWEWPQASSISDVIKDQTPSPCHPPVASFAILLVPAGNTHQHHNIHGKKRLPLDP